LNGRFLGVPKAAHGSAPRELGAREQAENFGPEGLALDGLYAVAFEHRALTECDFDFSASGLKKRILQRPIVSFIVSFIVSSTGISMVH